MAENVYPHAYSVSEINYYLKEYLAEDEFLSSLAVSGEVAGFKAHASGHIYLTLRDGEHSLKAVMFRRYAASLAWLPRDGEQIVVVGSVALYERDGVCQLYAEALFPAGAGLRAKEREALRQRLQNEGLFAEERKRPLPFFPRSIGVVSAENSAAWADLRRIIAGRAPSVKVKLYPAVVQGAQAPQSLAEAIAKADRGGHDVLICGRGGGAEEDLAAFDTELVVRAIAATKTPLISAVGHESDFTLADLAADARAATPTHAATMAVPDASELLELLDGHERRLRRAAARLLEPLSRRMEAAERVLSLAAGRNLAAREQRLAEDAARLDLLSPLATLARGYAIATTRQGTVIAAAGQVAVGEIIYVHPARGRLTARVEDIENGGSADGESKNI